MIFDYFKKRREARAAQIREQEERIRETTKRRREDARQLVESSSRSRSTYDDTPYVAPNYSTYDSASTWSDSSSSSSYDSGSSSCDSGGGGGGGCD
jgi:hypothetical protein